MDNLYKLVIACYLVIGVNSNICNKNEDCDFIGGICENEMCVCPVGQVRNTDGTKCLNISIGIGAPCMETVQCTAWIYGNAICTQDKVCGCEKKYKYANNKCEPAVQLNNPCNRDEDCFDGVDLFSMKCDKNTCVCNDGYYKRKNFDCRPSATYSEGCFFDIDCENPDENCEFGYGPLGKCTSSIENKILQSNYSGQSIFYENNDDFTYNTININCNTNDDCTSISNSFCPAFRKICTCKSNYIYDKNSNSCVAEIGLPCMEAKNCPLRNSHCNEKGLCQCDKYFITSQYREKCLKPARGIGMSCGRDENCFSLGNLGVCKEHQCQCSSSSEFDEKSMLCTVRAGNLPCGNNCEDKPNSHCVSDTCLCIDGYFPDKNRCVAELGSECSIPDDNCIIPNATCIQNKCSCNGGFLQVNNTDNSIPYVSVCLNKLTSNDDCKEDLQCIDLLGDGGVCNKNQNKCICSSDYIEMTINGSTTETACFLKKNIGDDCITLNDCKTIQYNEHVQCRNNKCVCAYDYYATKGKNVQRCTSGGNKLVHYSFIIFFLFGLNFIMY